jgi:hypothetical protein
MNRSKALSRRKEKQARVKAALTARRRARREGRPSSGRGRWYGVDLCRGIDMTGCFLPPPADCHWHDTHPTDPMAAVAWIVSEMRRNAAR